VIAAAGSGLRLGAGGPKALISLAGRPMIEWSLAALDGAESIGAVVVAAPSGHEEDAERCAGVAAPGTPATVIAGGPSRAESVQLALGRVESELVAIHDAARPLVLASHFDRLVERLGADEADAAIIAAPIADTVKRAAPGGEVAATLDRSDLWGAQTPQAFRAVALRAAHEAAGADGTLEAATDEASLIEANGGRVLLEPAGAPNLKVTDPADLAVAEAVLRARSI
jgi:2-C-methyl-D-erythritol 4-phosphate cytidylyltransferase